MSLFIYNFTLNFIPLIHMEFFKDWIIANFGISALVLVGLICLAIYIGGWVMKLKKDIANKPCQAHKDIIEAQSRKQESDSALLHEIQGELRSLARLESGIHQMSNTLQILAAGFPTQSPLTQSHSPISLTALGKEIAEKLNFKELISANWDKIESIIDSEKNPYDIQMEFITKFITCPEMYLDKRTLDIIKNDAFLRGISLLDYMRMIGIMSRDKYFAEHNINIEDVDRNDPLKRE